MSTRRKIPYAQAFGYAETVLTALAPSCERIVIAGSLRRQRPTIGDIEIVCVPKQVTAGLFEDETLTDPRFIAAVNQWPKVKGDPGGKYTQRLLPNGMMLDLFMADRDNYGAILLIRTGDAAFSKEFMGRILPAHGYRQYQGSVWRQGVKIPMSEETHLFQLVHMPFIEPINRQ